MLDLFEPVNAEPEIVPGRKLTARVAGVYTAPADHFETRATEALAVGFEGIAGDFHAGMTRRSGGREPWYPRGTEIRNERQLSLVAPDEMARVAQAMGISEIRAEWVGANLSIEGLPRLSLLPSGTLLFFKGGVTLKIDGMNNPCRQAGRLVAEQARMTDQQAGAFAFVKAAKRLRGLVAWVEKPGLIRAGEDIAVRVPEQWIYRG